MKYVPLNIKTEYDLMNSLIKIDKLISYANKNDFKALAITDTNMFGTYEFITKCTENNLKPIVGCELNIDNMYLVLYAKNYSGLTNLFKIISKKNIEEKVTLDYIKEFNDIICVTSSKHYDNLKQYFNNIYIKYHDNKTKEEAQKHTNNIVYMDLIRYFSMEDKEYFSYLKYIDENKTLNDKISVYDSYFKLDINEEDAKTTIEFSNQIQLTIPKSHLHIPVYKENSLEYLKALAKKGLEKRLNGNVSDVYKKRLIYELSVIEKMNYVDYFLIVYDFVLFAKKNNILVGPGRGSGAASLVNYALGIINIDPLKYNLIFERFLNPDRISMPDIDIDFDNLKREEVIKYVTNKYGENNTARIISFNTMLPKQVIRDTAKVMLIDSTIIDKLCKTIHDEKDFLALKDNIDFMNIVMHNDKIKYLIKVCNKLCGLKKNTSMHAAGVVISDIELFNFMPLYKSNNVILTGYSMEYIETMGLLKMDFLSIKNLNTISNILQDINKDGNNLDINKIPLDDKKTLNLFKNAYTTGIFQFESSGMKNFLKDLEVDSFDTLVDAIALYRPGPREMIGKYILCKKDKSKITYPVKELEDILKSTYGVIIYQEQVLEILRKVGSYTYAEADTIRRAMSKKKESVILNEKEKFTNRVISKGYTKEIAEELYNLIIKFSSYGFNKSHSVVYSLVAFQMAYLKVNYSLYFMKNLLNMNKSSEMIKEYIDESKILKIEFLNVDINSSSNDFIIENNKLRIPFSLIKSIAFNVSDEIEKERKKGPFRSFYDFMIRCYGKSINKRVVISLIECGAFDSFNINKRQMIINMDEILNYISLCKELNIKLDNPIFEEISDFTDKEIIDNELKNYGFYLSNHPVTKYDRSNMVTLNDYKKYFDKTITCILYLENIKNIKTKNADNMCFIKLSDEYNSIEGIIFNNVLSRMENLNKNNVYKINAKVEKRNNTYQLIIYNMVLI